MTAPRLLVVDDHPAMLSGLAAILTDGGFAVVATARSLADALPAIRALRPDVVLLDLDLPDSAGTVALERVTALDPAVRVLALSAQRDDLPSEDECRRSGACGVLSKSADAGELLAAVRDALRRDDRPARGAATSPATRGCGGAAGHGGELTRRELEVLQAVSHGLTNRQVATRLGVAEDTVKTHLARSMSKLAAADRTHAVALLLRSGRIA